MQLETFYSGTGLWTFEKSCFTLRLKLVPTIAEWDSFFKQLRRLTQVKSLVFDRQALVQIAPDRNEFLTGPLQNYIQQLTTLKSLDMCGSALAGTLFPLSLSHNNHLEDVYLDYCNLGDYDVMLFGEVLKINTTLRLLSIKGNSFGDESFKYLCMNIAHYNTVLSVLRLDYNHHLTTRSLASLADAVRANRSLLLASHPLLVDPPKSGCKTPAASLPIVDMLQCHLERNASLRWENVQPVVVDAVLALHPLKLPPYVVLHIVEQLPDYDFIPYNKLINCILAATDSIARVRRRREQQERENE